MTPVSVLGNNLTIVTQILGVLSEPGRKPKRHKINNRMLFNLIPTNILEIIKEMYDGIFHQENFSTVLPRLTDNIIPLLR